MLKKPDFSTITLAIQNQAIVNSHGRTIFQVFAGSSYCGTVYFISLLAEIVSLYQSRSVYLGIVSRLLLACFKRSKIPCFALLSALSLPHHKTHICNCVLHSPTTFDILTETTKSRIRRSGSVQMLYLLCLNVLVILKRRLLPLMWFMYDLAKMRCRLLSIQ